MLAISSDANSCVKLFHSFLIALINPVRVLGRRPATLIFSKDQVFSTELTSALKDGQDNVFM